MAGVICGVITPTIKYLQNSKYNVMSDQFLFGFGWHFKQLDIVHLVEGMEVIYQSRGGLCSKVELFLIIVNG